MLCVQNHIGHFEGKALSLNNKYLINPKWAKVMLLLSLCFMGNLTLIKVVFKLHLLSLSCEECMKYF